MAAPVTGRLAATIDAALDRTALPHYERCLCSLAVEVHLLVLPTEHNLMGMQQLLRRISMAETHDWMGRPHGHQSASSRLGTPWRAAGLTLLLACAVPPSPVWAGKGVGEDAAYAREMGFEQRFFYVASGNGAGQVEYICQAYPRTALSTASAVWRVQKFTYDSSNRLSSISFAAGDDAFSNICDNRASLTYN